MTTFDWNISQMETKPQEDGNTDVVITAHWNCTGVDGSYSAYVYGTCSFPSPGANFIPYEDLTESDVLGWCWANGVDQVAVEANLQAQIDAQINPPVVTLPLPWTQPAA